MTGQPSRIDLPPQLCDLSARTQTFPGAVRTVLEANLADDAMPKHVVTDAFARLGYRPEEAKQSTLKLPAGTPQGSSGY